MTRHPIVRRIVILAFVVAAALAASSCDNVNGMGVGMGYPARWGGSSSGPPIFVGGPSS